MNPANNNTESNQNSPRVLVCPLNWGLGHATRCVPVIRKYLSQNYDVTIVADGYPLIFLKQEFPLLKFIELPSYPVLYSSGKSQVGVILRSLPKIIKGIQKEKQWLRKLLKTEHFDLIISDNRFGLYSNKIYSVYITHQLMIKMPLLFKFIEPLAWKIHQKIILKYKECWIPDIKGNQNLSGDLSHKYPLPDNAKFIGFLSRFEKVKTDMDVKRYHQVAIISGPEPQRTIFENFVINKYCNLPNETLIISGKPAIKTTISVKGFVTIINHLPDEKIAGHLILSDKIICRSGYSTIMDLKILNCLHKAEFYPTAGQTEQEYLAEYHKKSS